MGLDMYLYGRKWIWGWRKSRPQMDGFDIAGYKLSLGYWRKHPNLHGYIVQTFAEGEDECQQIELQADDLRNIIRAVDERRLPMTTGFFFGASDGSERDEDLRMLSKALLWLETKDEEHWRSVIYQASW